MKPHPQAVTAVILSGGSEVISVAIAEALESKGTPYAVLSLVRHTLLKNARGCVSITDLSDAIGDLGRLRERMLDALTQLRESAGRRLVIFATEDGGLRCLNEFSGDVLKVAEFPRARLLRYGGLDKAELFRFLAKTPAARYIPATEIIDDFEAAEGVLLRLGADAVFKPALKPLDMDLRSMRGAKVVTRASTTESMGSLLRRLNEAWGLSKEWVVQTRLQPYENGERGTWAVRGTSGLAPIEFVERWKYPKQGGTGCWVETVRGETFFPAAQTILDSIDYFGLAELPFLRGADGQGRLLEINARAWLQVGLAERSGLAVVARTLRLFESVEPEPQAPLQPTTWINVERAVAAAAQGSEGPRWTAFSALAKVLLRRPVLAIYSSSVRGVKLRWVGRMFGATLKVLRRRLSP